MTLLFAETPDATQAFEFWNTTSGTITYDTTTGRKSGLATWKHDSTGSDVLTELRGPTVVDVNRVACYVRFTSFPDSTVLFLQMRQSGNTPNLGVGVSSGGVLTFIDDSGAETTGSTLSTGVDYLVVLAQDRTVTPDIKVFLDGNEDISATDVDDGSGDLNSARFGWLATPGANKVLNMQHHYVDDVTDLTDPGDVRVTSKLPLNSGGTNGWDGNIGTPAVDDRPIDESTGHIHAGSDDQVESSDIETAGNGDVDIGGLTLVGHLGWVWADRGNGGSGSPSILVGDVETGISLLAGTPSLFQDIITSTSYPSGTDQIGMHSTDAGADTRWYEGGILLVYIAAAEAPATSQAYAFWF